MGSNKIFGMVNMGNTCFINSVLQILFNVKPLTDFIIENEFEHPIIQQYKKVLIYWKNNQSDKIVKPYNLYNAIYDFTDFKKGQQQDVHEFLYKFVDIIHENIKSKNNKITYKDQNWNKFCKNNYSIIIPIFYGQLKNTINCICGNDIVRKEQVYGITLDVNENNISLDDCLNNYFNNNIIHDYQCEKCKIIKNVYQKKRMEVLPDYMIIQLNRFSYGHKNHNILRFSNQINIDKYVDLKLASGNTYDLDGIICHYGTLHGGHYNVVLNHNDTWYYVDDENIYPSNTIDVQNIMKNSYILIYKKIKNV